MPGGHQQASRDELHVLLDRIPDSEVPTARKILRALADPVKLALLNAPLDLERMSDHERAAWDADRERRRRGEPPVAAEEVLRDLGLTEEDVQ
jgi:hypothetical protein